MSKLSERERKNFYRKQNVKIAFEPVSVTMASIKAQ